MVDTYQTGEPIPDGHVTLQLTHPMNPTLEYVPENALPSNLEDEFYYRVNFADIVSQQETTYGIVFKFSDHREVFPWHIIHNYSVTYNSEQYLEELGRYQLRHAHEWQPRVDDNGYNYQWCAGCKVSDTRLKELEQREIDRVRGL